MQIKRFEAKSMSAALRLIKAELGPEAVILSARSIKKGSRILGSLKSSGVEVTAAIDTYSQARSNSERPARKAKAAGQQAKLGHPYPAHRTKRVMPSYKDPTDASVRKDALIESSAECFGEGKKVLFELYHQLLSQDVDADIAGDLTEGIKLIPAANQRLLNGESKSVLASLLEHMGLNAEPIQLDPSGPKIIAFLGTSGAGKTTTIAKLAAHFSIDHNKDVGLITFDDMRIAAIEQIRAFAKIMGVPIEAASNRSDLKTHLKRFKRKDLILIDTPGFSQKNSDQIKELLAHFEKLNAIQIQLVLAAPTKEKDLMDTIKSLEAVGTKRLVFTKLDETNTVGNLLNVLIRTNIPLSYITAGQQVPDDIRPASIAHLVQLLFRNRTASNFQQIAMQSAGTEQRSAAISNGSQPTRSAIFVANRNSDVYHSAGCKWTKKIKRQHIITFESAEAAAQKHFLPCRNCNPEQVDRQPIAFSEGDKMNVKVSKYN
jgi:flagellar biosynthesis protein FlhF